MRKILWEAEYENCAYGGDEGTIPPTLKICGLSDRPKDGRPADLVDVVIIEWRSGFGEDLRLEIPAAQLDAYLRLHAKVTR